jgi:hypothetical protein
MPFLAQAANHSPITTEAGNRSLGSSCEIYGGQSGTGAGCSNIYVSPVIIIPPVLHNHLYLNISLTKGKGGRRLATSGAMDLKNPLSHLTLQRFNP